MHAHSGQPMPMHMAYAQPQPHAHQGQRVMQQHPSHYPQAAHQVTRSTSQYALFNFVETLLCRHFPSFFFSFASFLTMLQLQGMPQGRAAPTRAYAQPGEYVEL